MIVAMTIWNGRISPVFDTARSFLLTQVDGHSRLASSQLLLEQETPAQRIDRMRALHVDTLICGALSQSLAEMLAAAGIRVIPFVAGDTEEVLSAFVNGRLPAPGFAMPGCRCGQGRRFQGGRRNCGARPQCESRTREPEKE